MIAHLVFTETADDWNVAYFGDDDPRVREVIGIFSPNTLFRYLELARTHQARIAFHFIDGHTEAFDIGIADWFSGKRSDVVGG